MPKCVGGLQLLADGGRVESVPVPRPHCEASADQQLKVLQLCRDQAPPHVEPRGGLDEPCKVGRLEDKPFNGPSNQAFQWAKNKTKKTHTHSLRDIIRDTSKMEMVNGKCNGWQRCSMCSMYSLLADKKTRLTPTKTTSSPRYDAVHAPVPNCTKTCQSGTNEGRLRS